MDQKYKIDRLYLISKNRKEFRSIRFRYLAKSKIINFKSKKQEFILLEINLKIQILKDAIFGEHILKIAFLITCIFLIVYLSVVSLSIVDLKILY